MSKINGIYAAVMSILNDDLTLNIERTIKLLNQNANEIACVLIDLVPHRVGLIPATKEYIDAIYKWTRENNAIFQKLEK